MAKMEEIVALVKQADAKLKEEKWNKAVKTILAVIGVIVIVAAIAYAVYKYMTCCKQEDDFEIVDAFEDEESCIELEFVYPNEEEAVPAEAEEE